MIHLAFNADTLGMIAAACVGRGPFTFEDVERYVLGDVIERARRLPGSEARLACATDAVINSGKALKDLSNVALHVLDIRVLTWLILINAPLATLAGAAEVGLLLSRPVLEGLQGPNSASVIGVDLAKALCETYLDAAVFCPAKLALRSSGQIVENLASLAFRVGALSFNILGLAAPVIGREGRLLDAYIRGLSNEAKEAFFASLGYGEEPQQRVETNEEELFEAAEELGLPPGEYTERDIKTAYKKRGLQTHPDKNGNSLVAEEAFKKVGAAKDLLAAAAEKTGTVLVENVREEIKSSTPLMDSLYESTIGLFSSFFGERKTSPAESKAEEPLDAEDGWELVDMTKEEEKDDDWVVLGGYLLEAPPVLEGDLLEASLEESL